MRLKTGGISETQATSESFATFQKLLEAKKHGYLELLKLAKGNADKETEYQQQIKLLDYEISQQKIDNAQKVYDAKSRADEKEIKLRDTALDSYKNVLDDLNGKLNESANLTEYSRVQNLLLGDSYKSLTADERENLLSKAAQIDALKQAKESYAQFKDVIGESVNAFMDGGFKGLFDSIKNRFKRFLADMITEWLTSKIFKVFSGQSIGGQGGQIGVGSGASGASFSGDIWGNLIKLATGGGSSGGRLYGSGSSNGGMVWHLANGAGGSGTFGDYQLLPPSGLPSPGDIARGGNKGGWSGIFGKGGIFGDKGFGNNVGTYGAIGTGASVLGGLFGGRVGGIISGAGMGLALGAQIGSIVPGLGTAVGALIGAGAGALLGFFGFSDPKRKRDKNEKLPQLQQVFGDALQQMRDLVKQVEGVTLGNALNFNADEITNKASQLRAQIASGGGVQFESKKYQKEAQKQIQSNLTQFDQLNAQLQIALAAANLKKEQASAADERDGRLIAEFASGVDLRGRDDQMRDVQQFKRRNGILTGGIPQKDSLPSLLMPGEMVLNPVQINAVIQAAGGVDVFRPARIPGYATGTYVQPASFSAPSFSSVGASSTVNNFEVNIPVTINGDDASADTIADAIIDAFSTDRVKKKLDKAVTDAQSRRMNGR